MIFPLKPPFIRVFHGYVSHNQMVKLIFGHPPKPFSHRFLTNGRVPGQDFVDQLPGFVKKTAPMIFLKLTMVFSWKTHGFPMGKPSQKMSGLEGLWPLRFQWVWVRCRDVFQDLLAVWQWAGQAARATGADAPLVPWSKQRACAKMAGFMGWMLRAT